MQRPARVSWLLILAFALPWSFPEWAGAQAFSSSCDRFEGDGNAFGPFDGVADFVDEFDDGTILPEWSQLLGTSVEAGGVVTLRDPGTPIPLPGFNQVTSNIENEDALTNGSGNFTVTSYWVPVVPATNSQFHMQLYGLGSVIEAAGLSFSNLSAAAAAMQPGALAGPAVSQQLTYIGGSTPPQFATVPINPADITGRIVFRISFDDATDMMTSSFSLDDGATFQSPFPPLLIFNGVSETEVLLGAAAGPPPPPPPPPPTQQMLSTQLLMVKNPGLPYQRKIVYRVKEPAPSDDYILGDPPVYGATLSMVLDATAQCFYMPWSGWTYLPGGFRYTDSQGAYGPVKTALVRRTNGGAFMVKMLISGFGGPVDLVPPNPGTQAATNLRFGPNAEYCSSTAGGTLAPNDAKTFRARNAPAPSSCYVVACSPSGAFLDDVQG